MHMILTRTIPITLDTQCTNELSSTAGAIADNKLANTNRRILMYSMHAAYDSSWIHWVEVPSLVYILSSIQARKPGVEQGFEIRYRTEAISKPLLKQLTLACIEYIPQIV